MKLIFLDIDGTLLDHDVLHGIPQSAKEAVRQTRAKGNKVILSTGRPKSNVKENIIDFETDAQIYAAGAHIEENGKLLEQFIFDKDKCLELTQDMETCGFGVVLEGIEHNFCNELAIKHFLSFEKAQSGSDSMGVSLNYKDFLPIQEYINHSHDVNKLTFYAIENENLYNFLETHKDEYEFTRHRTDPNGYTGYECYLKGINKGRAVHIMRDYFHVLDEDTVAYGDSMNDYEMLQAAHLGIAMGNSVEALKQIADEVCGKVSENGLYESFKKHGLI